MSVENHKGAREFPREVDVYITQGIAAGHIIGPFPDSPFWQPVKISPLNSVEKKDSSERRIILDLSFPPNRAVNDGIDKNMYLGNSTELAFPTVDTLHG